MPEPLDLEAIRKRADACRFCSAVLPHIESAGDVPDLIAEIERLRAIAAPLERLEAWRCGRRKPAACIDIHSDKPGVTVELDDGAGDDWGRIASANRETLPAAIAAALDAWEQQHGKDGV